MEGSGGRVDKEKVSKAVDALLKWVASRKEQDRMRLLDDEQLLYLAVVLKKVPERGRVNPFKIALPHPLMDGSQEVCLIVNDLSRGMPRKEAKQRVLQEGLRVSKVLGLTKLKSDYGTHESRRKLCGSYDQFFADRNIVKMLPKLLGKVFYKKKKHPITIDLSRKEWRSQLESCYQSTFFYLGPGSCSVIRVGKISQSKEEIVANVLAVIDGVAECIPKKWKNIMALHLKSLESLALPIYQTAPEIAIKIDVNTASENVQIVKLLDENEASKVDAPTQSRDKKRKETRKGKIVCEENVTKKGKVSCEENVIMGESAKGEKIVIKRNSAKGEKILTGKKVKGENLLKGKNVEGENLTKKNVKKVSLRKKTL